MNTVHGDSGDSPVMTCVLSGLTDVPDSYSYTMSDGVKSWTATVAEEATLTVRI